MATVILLNGVGSAGKSSIAKALQEITSSPFLHVQMDSFISMLPEALQDDPVGLSFQTAIEQGKSVTRIQTGPIGRRLLSGMRVAIAALAAEDNNLIVDDVLLDGELAKYTELLGAHRFHIVGVFASLSVLEERELRRGDRRIGLARWQYDRVHRNVEYDLRIETDSVSPLECALRIKNRFVL